MKISKSGIAPQQQIKSEHVTRIIDALSGETPNTEIQISGSITASYFIGDGSLLTNIPTGSGGIINTGSFATTGSNIFLGGQYISSSVFIEKFQALSIGEDTDGIVISKNNIEIRDNNITSQVTINPNSFTISNNDNQFSVNITSGSLPYSYIDSNLGQTNIYQHPSQSGAINIYYPTQSGVLSVIDCRTYHALLTQTGSLAPTSIVLRNDFNEIPTFDYIGVGIYELNISQSLFLDNKTSIIMGSSFRVQANVPNVYRNNDQQIIITTFDKGGDISNNMLYQTSIKIEIFD